VKCSGALRKKAAFPSPATVAVFSSQYLCQDRLIKYSQGFARRTPLVHVGVQNDGDSKAAEGRKVSLEDYTNTQFTFEKKQE